MERLGQNSLIPTFAAIIFLGSLPVVATTEITTSEAPLDPAATTETTEEAAKVLQAKDDMTKALNIAVERVDERKADLERLNFSEGSPEASLKVAFSQDLDASRTYYLEKLDVLATLTTLDEVKNLAQEIKTYREEIYAPEGQRIVTFISLYANEVDLGIAEERFGKIKTDLENLKALGLIDDAAIGDQVNLIDGLLRESTSSQDQAKELILAQSAEGSTEANQLIQDTMARIKTVYDLYLGLSGEIRNKLGLE